MMDSSIMPNDVFDCPFNNKLMGIPENKNTIAKFMKTVCMQFPNRRLFGTREFLRDGGRGAYEWYSYEDIYKIAILLAKGLEEIGIYNGQKIGIIAPNRTEWTIFDFACASLGITIVPIYDTQSLADIEFVCKDSQITTIISSIDKLDRIKHLKQIIKQVILLDDKIDDRAILQKYNKTISIPTRTFLAPKSQIYFDKLDKLEGIYDPSPYKYPKLDSNDQHTNIIRFKPNDKKFYPYMLLQSDVDLLTKEIKKDPDFSMVTHTFWQLCDKGYDAIFEAGDNATVDPEAMSVFHDNFNTTIAKPDSLYTLVYTSGTTGTPKGVMLTQFNVLWTGIVWSNTRILEEKDPINSKGQKMKKRQEYFICYLPLAHIYMRSLMIVSMQIGSCLGFWRGSSPELLTDIKELRITGFFLVPRIVQKVVEGITSKVDKIGGFKRAVFNNAFKVRQQFLQKEKEKYNQTLLNIYEQRQDISTLENYEYNQLKSTCPYKRFDYPKSTNIAFKQFPGMLGGRCRLAVTGSAPMSQAHGEFFVICFNLHLFEGFGMSETSAHGGVQSIFTMNYGSIGEALDKQTRMRIQSIPEMNYTINDIKEFEFASKQLKVKCPRGELLFKSPSMFQGYYNDPKKTAETLIDGWLHTGDVAEYNPVTKEVKLIDRKRGIIKLSQGEYISISQIEDAISKSRYVEQTFLYANRFYPVVVCIVVPNKVYLQSKGHKTDNVAQDRKIIEETSIDVKDVCKKAALRGFEIPRICLLEDEPWTPENGMLTPALKIKRPACKDKYEPICIDLLEKYSKLEGAQIPQLIDILISTINGERTNRSNYEGASQLNFSK